MRQTISLASLAALPVGKTLLLEASAGTGKTWQIEALVVRLVAEYEVPIDRILVITFTNAAAAELRDRIRARLGAARDALGRSTAPSDDPVLEALWAEAAQRPGRQARLAQALSEFDLAPISTIHGFSQRMLGELAFQSGQEPGLQLCTDPSELLRRIVDDELASLFARATDEELVLLGDMGIDRTSLLWLAKAMTNAVAPRIEPSPPGLDSASMDLLEPARRWLEHKQAFRSWLDSEEAATCIAAVRDELERKRDKRLDGRRMRRDVVGSRLEAVVQWLDGPGCRSSRTGGASLGTAVRNLSASALEAAWDRAAGAPESFGGYRLFARVSELGALQDRLWPLALAAFAHRVRGRFEQELDRAGALTYGTMISRLAERIAEQSRTDAEGGPLARAIRERFDVALVDEFQDTDGAQWPVLKRVFAHPSRRLIVIGDPKQAIYAFRGADVHVYLDAAAVAHERSTMRTNWRSDAAFVAAMNHLWSEGSSAFDLAAVDYVAVASAPSAVPARMRNARATGRSAPRRPLELRWVDGEAVGAPERAVPSKEVAEELCAELAADETALLLDGSTELLGRDGRWRALEPGDVAVLVRTNEQAELVRGSLAELRIPAVSAGRGSVLHSPVVGWLAAWLDAVAAPGRDRPARVLATTPLFGWSARELALGVAGADAPADPDDPPRDPAAAARWSEWLASIARWARAWPSRGFVGVLEAALDDYGVVRRLLGAAEGDRYATDLRHLVELCHAEERRTRPGPFGLASWLRSARANAGDGSNETEALRLESDARAVQLVTVHKSKGLEYPVVLVPFAWADFQANDEGPLFWHAQTDGGAELRLSLELAGTGRRDEAVAAAARELRQEQTRLLYVALTRARHHAVAWLGPLGKAAADADSYALGRLALRARDGSGKPLAGSSVPSFPRPTSSKKPEVQAERHAKCVASWQLVRERLDRLAETSGDTVAWSAASSSAHEERRPADGSDLDPLRARPWPASRSLGSPWQVSSYSAMAAGRRFDPAEPQRLDEIHATEPSESREAEDEADQDAGAQVELGEPRESSGGAALERSIATAGLHGGTKVGTFAHAVLEELDFVTVRARDGRALADLVATLGARHGVRTPEQQALLAALLPEVLDTPLDGGVTGLPEGFSLRALSPADRLDELGFDLRLGEGSRYRSGADPGGGLLNHEGAAVALESRLGDERWGGEGWLRAVLDRAACDELGVLPRIAGILTGFVDLVFRVAGDGERTSRPTRYYLADYKTNRIASPSARRDSLLRHYTKPWLAWEMARHGYHLQSLLYTVALHRLLRQRIAHYSYDEQVGGQLYLFLRGMGGAESPRDAGVALGVYVDRWPASVVLGLDAALCGASTADVRAIVGEASGPGGTR